MPKSKTNFDAFDKHNTKVQDLDLMKVRATTKAQLKKVAAVLQTETPFYLILRYFLDKNDKPVGHFLDVGEHKKLSKHFEQVEIKAGKPRRRMSKNPKEACLGTVYVDEANGSKVVHFDPHPKSKIPKGKWPKILKELKPFLSGMKAVVIIDGQVVASEESEEETPNTETATPRTDEAPNEGLKRQWSSILDGIKNRLPKEILPRIKDQSATDEDLSTVDQLLNTIETFLGTLAMATPTTQATFAKAQTSLTAQLPKLKNIQARLQELLLSSDALDGEVSMGTDPNDKALKEQLQRLIEEADQGLKDFEAHYQYYKNQLEEEQPPLAGGDQFLAFIA